MPPSVTADVNEDNRVQLAQGYELHVGWMNAKNHVFMPLARLLYPPDAFEKRSIDLRCRYVAVYASEEKKTAKSGGTYPREAVTATRDESPLTGEYTSRRKGEIRREWRFSDPRATATNTSRRQKTKTADIHST